MLWTFALQSLDEEEQLLVERLYETYKKKIYWIAESILQNSHDAEDVVVEVMLNVIRNIEKFSDSDGNEQRAQLVIYSRNAAINLYRKKRRRRANEVSAYPIEDEENTNVCELVDDAPHMDEILLSRENAAILKRYLSLLSQEQKDTVALVYGLGYSNAEAARILHITPNAVGLRLFKAKKRLLELGGEELYACIR